MSFASVTIPAGKSPLLIFARSTNATKTQYVEVGILPDFGNSEFWEISAQGFFASASKDRSKTRNWEVKICTDGDKRSKIRGPEKFTSGKYVQYTFFSEDSTDNDDTVVYFTYTED